MIYIILSMLLGLCLGSFFNVTVSRENWVSGRSRCDACGHELKWFELIPVISFLALRGKCRYCKEKISTNHLFAELLMGFGCGVVAICGFDMWEKIMAYIAVIILGYNAISDMHDKYTNSLVVYAGIICIAVIKLINYQFAMPGVAINTAIYLMFAAMCYLTSITASRYVGAGDYEIIFLLFLCSRAYSLIIFFSIIVTSVYMMLVNKKVTEGQTVAFVPYLYIGYLISILIGGSSL